MMADSTKNNTLHGGEGHHDEEDVGDLPENIGRQRTGPPDQSEEARNQDEPIQSRLQSPTMLESGYNTEASPATTSSSHGTPGQHFDFNNLPRGEETVPRQKPSLTIYIPSYEEDDDHSSHSDSQRQHTANSSTETPSADLLSIGRSKGMSQSFQDIRPFGVSSEDEEEGTEAEDELTNSEDKDLRESQRNQRRRYSLRRRRFGGDDNANIGQGMTDEEFDSLEMVPLPVFNVQHQDSHESHDLDQISPSASNQYLNEHVSSALNQFLGQEISSSSFGIVENPSEAPEVIRGDRTYRDDSRHSNDLEPQVFHLSISSDEENHREFRSGRAKDNKGVDGYNDDDDDEEDDGGDNDDVFTFEMGYSQDNACDSSQTRSPPYGSSTSAAIPAPHPSLASLRHSANSSPNIVADKPPISPSMLSSSLGRRRRNNCLPSTSSVSMRLQLSGGASLPHFGMSRSFSIGTQTPHRTSLLIKDVLSTPTALPNEARGRVVSRLRRLSENGSPLPPSPEPLPDIIPFVRNRSSSLPEIQAFDRRRVIQTRRLIGQELRRMSDEFNSSRRNSNSSNADFQQHASSFPGVRPLLSLVRGALQSRSRRGSSVDLEEDDPVSQDEES